MNTLLRFRVIAVLELVLAASLWGFGFIAAMWALQVVTAFELTFLRFLIAVAVAWPVVLWGTARLRIREYVRLSFVPAVLLTGTLLFQTWGLHYTTATKSGFITTLYVIFVPVLESLITGRRLPLLLWLCVLTSLIGTVLIVGVAVETINIGDLLTLVCALIAAVQIYWIGKISPWIGHPFTFNIYQAIWSMFLTLPLISVVALGGKLSAVGSWPLTAWLGVVILALGSTVIAFFLQVKAQKKLSPTVSSLLFLLESPFALLFAVLLLDESLRLREAVGATLIFVSAFAASFAEKVPCQPALQSQS